MTDGSRAAALKGTVFHRTHMGSFRPMGGRMPEGGCRREDARGRRPEAGGWRPEAGGQSQRPEAGGQKLARGWGGLDEGTDGCMDVIRKQLDVICTECIVRPSKYMRIVKNLFFLRDKKVHFFWSQRQFWGNFG